MKKASRPEPDKWGRVDMIPKTEGIPDVALEAWMIHGDWVIDEMEKEAEKNEP